MLLYLILAGNCNLLIPLPFPPSLFLWFPTDLPLPTLQVDMVAVEVLVVVEVGVVAVEVLVVEVVGVGGECPVAGDEVSKQLVLMLQSLFELSGAQ